MLLAAEMVTFVLFVAPLPFAVRKRFFNFLATSQIIAKGEYLQPSFDPKSLTIPHLIGIFAYHGVAFPAQHNKAKLVEIFNENIKKNAPNLMKQRLERQETMASEDGILDGVTGNPIVSTFTGP